MMRHFFHSCLVLLIVFGGCKDPGTKPNVGFGGDPQLSLLYTAFTQNPDSIALADRIIDTLANRGQFTLAAAWCDTLLNRQDPQLLIYQLVKADLLVADSQYRAAIHAYRAYLHQKSDEPVIFLKLANTMAEAKDTNTLKFCDSLLRRFDDRNDRSGCFFVKGYYLNTLGQYAAARPWLDSAIALNYNFTEAWMEKGYSYFDDQAFAQAAKVFEQLAALQKGNAEAWYWVGKANESAGQKDKAIDAYTTASDIDPAITEAKDGIRRLAGNQ